jgi:hypothetical protein
MLNKGARDYFWVFTPENIDLKPLEITYDYINPLQPVLDSLNERKIPERYALRIKLVKDRIHSIGDLTNEQMKELKDLAKAVFGLAQTGVDGNGKPIDTNYILPFFKSGLEVIGINLKKEELVLVYDPGTLPKPMTLEELEQKMAPPFPPVEIKKPVPVIIPEEKVEVIEEEPPKKEIRTTPLRRKVERKVYKERKKKPPKESLVSKVLETMLPGLLRSEPTYSQKIQTGDLGRGTVKQLEQSITEIDLQAVVPLPSYLYPKYARRFNTTEERVKEVYEKKMRDYVSSSKHHASILGSQNFYQITKILPECKEPFNEEELSQMILLSSGKIIPPKNIRENIKPLVRIGLVEFNDQRYKINEKFLEENNQVEDS